MEGRRAITCAGCAKQKIKCDKMVPCGRCRLKGLTCQPRYSCRSVDSTAQSRDRVQSKRSSSASNHSSANSRDSRNLGGGDKHASNMQAIRGSVHTPTVDSSFLDMDIVMAAHQLDDVGLHYDMLDFMAEGSDDFDGTLIMADSFNNDYSNPFMMTPQHGFQYTDTEDMSKQDSTHDAISNLQLHQIGSSNASGSVSPVLGALPTPRPSRSSASAFTVRETMTAESINSGLRQACGNSRAVNEAESILRGQDFWPAFKCNPPPQDSICPKSAVLYLEGLEHTLRDHSVWNDWASQMDTSELELDVNIVFRSFTGITRDVLLALTQEFLQKALRIHCVNPASTTARFIILPPQHVLDYFVRSCICRYRSSYTIFSFDTLDPTELIQLKNEKAGCLLLLMMISQGAIATPTIEARNLTSGLTEVCRISLLDIIAKDVKLSANRLVLQCALLTTISGAWSGDKWQMDIALGQRGMHIAMLQNAAFLNDKERTNHQPSLSGDLEEAWSAWREREHRSRLVYSWVAVDLELSLFHETMPLLSLKSLNTNMPSSEGLWQAKSASQWSTIWEQDREEIRSQQFSLSELFHAFIDGQLESSSMVLSPSYLNLLLHPIQALVYHSQQLSTCFSRTGNALGGSRSARKSTTRVRLQALLQQWKKLARRTEEAISSSSSSHTSHIPPFGSGLSSQSQCTSTANLVMFYLIFLNTMVSFPEIERIAASESSVAQMSFTDSIWIHSRTPGDSEEIFCYCGQILRLIKSMPDSSKPVWWAAAVYRVALIAWANSQIKFNETFDKLNLSSQDQFSGGLSMTDIEVANLTDQVLNSSSSSSSSLSSMTGLASENPRPRSRNDASSTTLRGGTQARSKAFVIDALMPDDPVLVHYMKYGEGKPMLTKNDRSLVSLLERPVDILLHCAELLQEDSRMRFTAGLGYKLERLAKRWGA